MRNLESLDLEGTQVSDDGLIHLKRLHVHLPGVSPAGLNQIAASLPNYDIVHWQMDEIREDTTVR